MSFDPHIFLTEINVWNIIMKKKYTIASTLWKAKENATRTANVTTKYTLLGRNLSLVT
jgi:hypothetical protein